MEEEEEEEEKEEDNDDDRTKHFFLHVNLFALLKIGFHSALLETSHPKIAHGQWYPLPCFIAVPR